MKIIHIIPSLKKGGAERISIDLCNELNKSSANKIVLISLSHINDYELYLKDLNFKVIESNITPSIIGKTKTDICKLNHFIESFNPDIIHTHLFKSEIIARWKIHKSAKYFSHCHDNMFQLKSFNIIDLLSKKRLTELYERKIMLNKYLKCNNSFITISNHTFNFYLKNLPAKLHKNVSILHNAINFERFKNSVIKVCSEKINIVNIGNFLPKKNTSFFIPIAKYLIKHGIRFQITLIGEGNTKASIIKKIKDEGLTNYFSFTGFVNKVEDYLSKADIYVHTAHYEPFGLVLLEAMASRTPVISLDGGGNSDIIKDKKNGFLIKEENAETFGKTIMELQKNKLLYNSIVEEGFRTAKKHDIKEYAEKLVELYKQTIINKE